jgi:carboxyl-terminal processing protease
MLAGWVVVFWLFTFWLGYNFADQFDNNQIRYNELNQKTQEQKTSWDHWRFTKFYEIDEIIKKELEYDWSIDITGMIEKSLHGYVEWVWDPYTEYFNTEENKNFLWDLQGDRNFDGIWAIVGKKSDGVIIQEIIKWSPAYQAWLKPQDIIVMIDEKPTKDMSVFESIGYIRGTGGTEVKLTIMRLSENKVFEVYVKRGKVNIPSVVSQIFNTWNINIGYITISILWEDTKWAFDSIANNLKYKQHISGVIIDLRGNWGGILDSAVDIASHFVSRGLEIVTTTFKSMSWLQYSSKWYTTLENIPAVIIIDELSASAAEILALALKYNNKATIVWQKSFGKGTIQTMSFLKDNSSIKYTIGKWFGPWNISINHTGIFPDYPVITDMTWFVYSGIDNQLEFAKDILFQKIIVWDNIAAQFSWWNMYQE